MMSLEYKFIADCSTPLEVTEKIFDFLGLELNKECYSNISFCLDGLHQIGDWCNLQVHLVWFRVSISVSGDSWCYKLYHIDINVYQLASSEP